MRERLVFPRFVNKDGIFNIRKKMDMFHPYEFLIQTSTLSFSIYILIFYVGINAFFGVILSLVGVEHLNGIEPGTALENFGNAFFFSVQTFTTVGYGTISPDSFTSDIIVAFIALVGLLSVALATGILFVRFSKPTNKIVFSHNAIISTANENKELQFRIANKGNNQLIDLEATVILVRMLDDGFGEMQRKFTPLKLEQNKLTFLPLSWTLSHQITPQSPLYNLLQKGIHISCVEIVVFIKLFDESFNQITTNTTSYFHEEIIVGGQFIPMYHPNEKGEAVLEIDKIDDYQVDLT